jgi:ribonuclease BN (tRNA processing enzyme)
MPSLKNMAKERYHLTVKQVAEIAKKSKSKRLFLMHISQRYSKELKKVLTEAKKTFRNSYVPKDLDFIKV